MSEKDNSRKKLSTTQIILIVGLTVLVAAVLGVGGLIISRMGEPNSAVTPSISSSGPAFGTGALVATADNATDMIAEIDRKAREGTYEVTMKMVWTFPDGSSPASDAYAANSESNHRPIYFDITMEDGTVIYTSPEIPVGMGIEDITLDVPLEKGSYPCVCTYHLLNDDKTELSSVSVALQIDILA